MNRYTQLQQPQQFLLTPDIGADAYASPNFQVLTHLADKFQAKQDSADKKIADLKGKFVQNAREVDVPGVQALNQRYNEQVDELIKANSSDPITLERNLNHLSMQIQRDFQPGGQAWAYEQAAKREATILEAATKGVMTGTVSAEMAAAAQNYYRTSQPTKFNEQTGQYDVIPLVSPVPMYSPKEVTEVARSLIKTEKIAVKKQNTSTDGTTGSQSQGAVSEMVEVYRIPEVRAAVESAFTSDKKVQGYYQTMSMYTGVPAKDLMDRAVEDEVRAIMDSYRTGKIYSYEEVAASATKEAKQGSGSTQDYGSVPSIREVRPIEDKRVNTNKEMKADIGVFNQSTTKLNFHPRTSPLYHEPGVPYSGASTASTTNITLIDKLNNTEIWKALPEGDKNQYTEKINQELQIKGYSSQIFNDAAEYAQELARKNRSEVSMQDVIGIYNRSKDNDVSGKRVYVHPFPNADVSDEALKDVIPQVLNTSTHLTEVQSDGRMVPITSAEGRRDRADGMRDGKYEFMGVSDPSSALGGRFHYVLQHTGDGTQLYIPTTVATLATKAQNEWEPAFRFIREAGEGKGAPLAFKQSDNSMAYVRGRKQRVKDDATATLRYEVRWETFVGNSSSQLGDDRFWQVDPNVTTEQVGNILYRNHENQLWPRGMQKSDPNFPITQKQEK